ncbi:hypothetical protein CR513_19208, partial [Mucuna pruriens]
MDELEKRDENEKGEESQEGESTTPRSKGRREATKLVPATKSSSIKCSKCLGKGYITLHYPNNRSMIMKEDGIVDSASSKSESSSISESNISCEYSPNKGGDLLVVRHLMNLQVMEDDASH